MNFRHVIVSGLALLLATPALAEGTPTVVRVFDHLVAFELPAGFAPAQDETSGDIHTWYALPQGETMENWTQAISLVSDKSRFEQDPSAGASMESSAWYKLCKDTFDESTFGSSDIPGSRLGGYGYWVSCGTRADVGPPRAENMLFVAISGPATSILGWARRPPAQDKTMTPHDDATIEPRLAALTASVRLCPLAKGEGPPYASCQAK